MRLFKGWFNNGKPQEAGNLRNQEKKDKDVEHGISEVPESNKCQKNEKLRMDAANFILRMKNMTILTIKTTEKDDEGFFDVLHKTNKMIKGAVLQKGAKTMTELLEYLQGVEDARVHIEGPLEKIKCLLEKIPEECFPKLTVEVVITDGLKFATQKEVQSWNDLALRIFIVYMRYLFTTDVLQKSSKFCATENAFLKASINTENGKHNCFTIKCPYMNIPYCEVIRVLLRFPIKWQNSYEAIWELVRKIIHEEADSYEETNNIINYVIDGKTNTIYL